MNHQTNHANIMHVIFKFAEIYSVHFDCMCLIYYRFGATKKLTCCEDNYYVLKTVWCNLDIVWLFVYWFLFH